MCKRISISLMAILLAICMLPIMPQGERSYGATDVRGLWLSFVDFEDMGLRDASAATYRSKISRLLQESKKYGINTVYFHARAFDDASWKSRTFKASDSLTSKASASRTAAATYAYDPLGIVIEECRKNGMRIEAWLNPYRIKQSLYLDPACSYSTNRINRAVNELKAYDLDGIHFDDYFYHSTGKYRTPTNASQYSISVTKAKKDFSKKPSKATMLANVNKMIRSVYQNTHRKAGLRFGVSPQGNMDNCMASGCDVKTWMANKGYVDYIAPQIYWTDQWGSKGNTAMYSQRLALWKGNNKANVDMYIGLALYQAGKSVSGDRGWGRKSTNLREQVQKLRAAGCEGFILFRANDLFRGSAAKELGNLRSLLMGQKPTIKAKKLKVPAKKITLKVGQKYKIPVSFVPANTTEKKLKFKSSKKKVAKVSKKGTITAKRPGKAKITVKAKGGAKVKIKVKVIK